MSLQQLVYISSVAQEYSATQLAEMLEKFRQNNQRAEITGILLHKNSRFMQLVEGEKHVVDKLFAKINLDPRHLQVLQIYNSAVEERSFAEWSMSFYDLNNPQVLQIPGYSDYLNTDLNPEIFKTQSDAIRFLRIFKLSTITT